MNKSLSMNWNFKKETNFLLEATYTIWTHSVAEDAWSWQIPKRRKQKQQKWKGQFKANKRESNSVQSKKTNSFSLAINDIKKKKKVIKINKHSLVIKKSLITSLTATSSPVWTFTPVTRIKTWRIHSNEIKASKKRFVLFVCYQDKALQRIHCQFFCQVWISHQSQDPLLSL